ncbi:hypothetical protein Zmor_025218 [Zophobas morio]|uniref:Nuclear cap-binding protein subunit 3 n=1 Tax=Zophobas morio TaxID=2755281 RepID=A0AA38M3P0_9CUCU|nr:hypothetical protein Zmor_025218 [Zophobas morio]
MRPNIRVEIQNNLVESMEVDENEEGEISDHEENETEEQAQVPPPEATRSANPPFPGFTTTEDKLQERAKRFALNPEEIKNFKDDDLQLLHSSLGISASNESNVRFEVIHMRGIEQMNAGDLLDYFLEYAPVSVEWIDEVSCNIVWLDKILSARALHFMSKPVRGMPVRDDTSYFDHLNESTEEVDQSILVINRNREVQLKEDSEEATTNKLLNEHNSVDISEITATIPPGYWRLGGSHPKAKCLLLRFALKTDKQHFKVEQFSRYYKNQSKKKAPLQVGKPPNQGIFGRNKDMRKVNEDNPWTVLAKNWDEDAQFREKERTQIAEVPKVEIKNHSLRNRLGQKRKDPEPEEPEEPEPVAPKKKVKIPRMRMYADEEEEKIKRKHMLQRINNQIKKIDQDVSTNSDLRTVLNMTHRTHAVKLDKSEPEVFDLGSRLKNRNKKMVFQIKSEDGEEALTEEVSHSRRDKEDRHRVHRRRYSHSDDEDTSYRRHDKPKSKVAVVIKTQKRPAVASAVASTVLSRVKGKSNSETESESESSESEGSESESEEVEELVQSRRITNRPGFTSRSKDHSVHSAYKSPLKIEINNDHFKRS